MAIATLGLTRRTSRHSCAAVFVALSVLSTTSAVTAQQAPPTQVDGLIRQAVERFEQARQGASSEATVEQSLSLDDAVKMALEKNLDIAVQRLNPQTYDLAIASVKAAYLPTVTSLIGRQSQASPPVSLLTGGAQVSASTATVNGQLTQNIAKGGGNLSVTWNNNRLFTNSVFYNYNPAFNSTFSAQYTQPLFRGLHADSARQQLEVTKVNRAISDLQLQATVTNTLTSVRSAYWDLVQAVQAVEVAKTSVELAQKLVDDNQKRVQAGTMTRLDLLTATSQEAADRHALVLAEGTRRTAELALRRLIVGGANDPTWRTVINPTDRPDDSPREIDLDRAVRRALEERTDLAQAKQQVTANDATLRYLLDQTRPQVDLVGSYALAGLGGARIIRSGNDIINSPIVGTLPGAFGNALGSLLGFDYPTWGVAVNVTYPIGYSAARAEAARAEIQVSQAAAQTRQLEVQVITDITNAAIAVRNTFDEIEPAKQARDLAEQRLDAEQKKFGVGMATNYLVVQAQKDLADARNALLRAEISYQKSLVDFDRAQQTTLQAAGVTIVSTTGLLIPSVGSGRPVVSAPSGAFIP